MENQSKMVGVRSGGEEKGERRGWCPWEETQPRRGAERSPGSAAAWAAGGPGMSCRAEPRDDVPAGTLLLCHPSSPFPGPAVAMPRAAGCPPPGEDPEFQHGEGGDQLMPPGHTSACLCSLLGAVGSYPGGWRRPG